MPTPTTHRRRITWRDYAFAFTLFCFVLLRGVNLAGVLAPFEGGDEYNYIAVAYYLDTHGTMPSRDDPVPNDPALRAYFLKYPHPRASGEQLAGLPVHDYEGKVFDPKQAKWVAPDAATPAPYTPNKMVQAQQGWLYFQVLVWLKHALGISDLGSWFDAARILNVILAAISVVIWFVILRICLRTETWLGFPYLASLLFAVNAHFIVAMTRVANSALPLCLGSAAFLLYCLGFRWRLVERRFGTRVGYAFTAGICAGLAVLARVTTLTVLPVLLLATGVAVWRQRGEWGKRGGWLPAVFLAGYLLVAGTMHYRGYRDTGSVADNYLTAKLHAEGKGILAILGAAGSLSSSEIRPYLLYNYIYLPGWSLRPAPAKFKHMFKHLTHLSLLLLVVAGFFSGSRTRLRDFFVSTWEVLLHLAVTCAALLYMGGVTKLTIGVLAPNTRYGLLALPALAALLLAGGFALSRWLAFGLTLVYVVLCSTVFYVMTYLDALFYQTGARGLAGALHTARTFHPFLHPSYPTTLTLEALALTLLLVLLPRPYDFSAGGSNGLATTC